MRTTMACAAALAVATVACTSKTNDPGPAGGPVAGAADSHCGAKVTVVDPGQCTAAAGDDAGAGAGGAGGGDDFGATMYGAEGDDDDCKYHVKWSAAPRVNEDATFTVIATTKADGKPLTGAKPYIEAFLGATHPAPNAPTTTTEATPGTYTIGPVRFDASGDWTVRFHFAADCNDNEQSPHGHAAFFVHLP